MLRKSGFTLILFLSLSMISLVGSAKADWGPDVRLTYNDSLSDLCGNSAQAIAVDGRGGVHLVWYDERDGNQEIYYKRSLDSGKTWGPDVRLTYYPTFSNYPAVAVDDSDCVHVVWVDRRVGNRWEIYYKRSSDRGITWGRDTMLSDTQQVAWWPAIAAGENGSLHVIWWNNDPNPDSSNIYYRRSLDWGETWKPVRILGGMLCREASIVALPGGLCHIASAGIFYRRSTDSGTTWSRDTLFTPISVADAPCIHSDERGNVHLAWQDQGRTSAYLDIYYKRSTDQGVTWGPEQRMTFTDGLDESTPVIAEDDSGLVHLLYRDDAIPGISYRCSTNNGVSWGPPIPLVRQAWAFSQHIVVDEERFAHVVWRDGRDGNLEIYYKRWESPSGIEAYQQDKDNQMSFKPMELRVQNPASRELRVKYYLSYNGNIKLIVYDIHGCWVRCLETGNKTIGFHEQCKKIDLPTGIYFLRLYTNYGIATQKVVVLK